MSDTSTDTTLPFPNFFSMWTEQGADRLESMVDQWEEWEERGADQAEEVLEQSAGLMRATLDYTLELNAELRKQAIENTRKTLTMMGGDAED